MLLLYCQLPLQGWLIGRLSCLLCDQLAVCFLLTLVHYWVHPQREFLFVLVEGLSHILGLCILVGLNWSLNELGRTPPFFEHRFLRLEVRVLCWYGLLIPLDNRIETQLVEMEIVRGISQIELSLDHPLVLLGDSLANEFLLELQYLESVLLAGACKPLEVQVVAVIDIFELFRFMASDPLSELVRRMLVFIGEKIHPPLVSGQVVVRPVTPALILPLTFGLHDFKPVVNPVLVVEGVDGIELIHSELEEEVVHDVFGIICIHFCFFFDGLQRELVPKWPRLYLYLHFLVLLTALFSSLPPLAVLALLI